MQSPNEIEDAILYRWPRASMEEKTALIFEWMLVKEQMSRRTPASPAEEQARSRLRVLRDNK